MDWLKGVRLHTPHAIFQEQLQGKQLPVEYSQTVLRLFIVCIVELEVEVRFVLKTFKVHWQPNVVSSKLSRVSKNSILTCTERNHRYKPKKPRLFPWLAFLSLTSPSFDLMYRVWRYKFWNGPPLQNRGTDEHLYFSTWSNVQVMTIKEMNTKKFKRQSWWYRQFLPNWPV